MEIQRQFLIFAIFVLHHHHGGSTTTEHDFRYISYKDLQFDFDTFSEDGVTSYSQLLFDISRNQVIVGARDVLYRLTLGHLDKIESARWESPEANTSMCLYKGQSEEYCHNYPKVLLTNGRRLLACGTNSFAPICTWREIDNITVVTEVMDGVAKCPYNPLANITALLTDQGDFLVGGPTDFSGSDYAIYKNLGHGSAVGSIRTKQYNSMWLNEPQFVGSFEADKYVYFLFREAAVEYINCGKIIYSRIARMCKSDKGGGQGQTMLRDNWTTFIKARLNCSVSGAYPFYYDEIQSSAYVAGDQVVYATFTTPPTAIAGSAVCAFNMTAINDAFKGPFKYRADAGSAWSRHYAQTHEHVHCSSGDSTASSDPGNSYGRHSLEISKYQLMDNAVQATTLNPLYTNTLERFTHITVDVLATKLHRAQHVMFVATDTGLIRKLTVLPRTLETCLVEVWQPVEVDANRPHLQPPLLAVQHLRSTNSVYVGTGERLLRISAHHCRRHVSINSCVNAQDPYCGWNNLDNACTAAPGGDPLVKHWKQEMPACPILNAPVDGGWSGWSPWEACAHYTSSSNAAGDLIDGSSVTVSIDGEDGGHQDQCQCRQRQCNNPAAAHGGRPCSGIRMAVANCTTHGVWTPWSAWSACTATCGTAVKVRTRTCNNPTPAFGGRVCVGLDRGQVLCTTNPPCPIPRAEEDLYQTPTPLSRWGDWGPWERCNVSCGVGYRRRVRVCNQSPDAQECTGCNQEFERCTQHACPERKATLWTAWYTTGTNNTRRNGGTPSGSTSHHHHTIQRRQKILCRTVTTNLTSYGGDISVRMTVAREEERSCRGDVCTINGALAGGGTSTSVNNVHWGTWTTWGECSVTCGTGEQVRTRQCEYGALCESTSAEVQQIQRRQCNVDYGCGAKEFVGNGSATADWGCWSDWSPCSTSCGWGIQNKYRQCSSGRGNCKGSGVQEQPCEVIPCGSLLGWDDWTVWSECNSNNEQHRKRACKSNNPSPNMCLGRKNETRMCSIDDRDTDKRPWSIDSSISNTKCAESSSSAVAASTALAVLGVIVFIALIVSGILFYRYRTTGNGLVFTGHLKRQSRVPSSPHYISTTKQNSYTPVPFRDRATGDNHHNNQLTNGTITKTKSIPCNTLLVSSSSNSPPTTVLLNNSANITGGIIPNNHHNHHTGTMRSVKNFDIDCNTFKRNSHGGKGQHGNHHHHHHNHHHRNDDNYLYE